MVEGKSVKPLVYDLYTGTGTIANFVARQARQVIGIEYVEAAIEDAKLNASVNGLDNTLFYAGDMKDILTDEFIEKHGRPDVMIIDPPRAGMHEDVVKVILRSAPDVLVQGHAPLPAWDGSNACVPVAWPCEFGNHPDLRLRRYRT